MGAANAGGVLRSSAHRAGTCLRACWAFQRAGASGWAWRGGQGRRAKVGKYAASRRAEAVVSAPVHGVQCTSSIALDDGRGQELRPVRGKGVYVVSPFVVRHIVGAVGPMLGPGTVEVEKFDALFVQAAEDIVNNEPHLIALDVDGIVVAALVQSNMPCPIGIGPRTLALARLDPLVLADEVFLCEWRA